MSPSANEGDDDMHERRIRSPSARFHHAGAAPHNVAESRGTSVPQCECPLTRVKGRRLHPDDSSLIIPSHHKPLKRLVSEATYFISPEQPGRVSGHDSGHQKYKSHCNF